MNPLALVNRIQHINAKVAAPGISDEASWRGNYKDSAYVYTGGIPPHRRRSPRRLCSRAANTGWGHEEDRRSRWANDKFQGSTRNGKQSNVSDRALESVNQEGRGLTDKD